MGHRFTLRTPYFSFFKKMAAFWFLNHFYRSYNKKKLVTALPYAIIIVCRLWTTFFLNAQSDLNDINSNEIKGIFHQISKLITKAKHQRFPKMYNFLESVQHSRPEGYFSEHQWFWPTKSDYFLKHTRTLTILHIYEDSKRRMYGVAISLVICPYLIKL